MQTFADKQFPIKKLYMKIKSFGRSLLAATILGMALTFVPTEGWAKVATMQQKDGTVKGNVVDEYGEPMYGAVAYVVGTTNSNPVDFDGNFELHNVEKGSAIRVTLMGYNCDDQIWNGGTLNFVMKEESTALEEVVVTAMGIMRKEKSLTYATQLIKADELLKAPDANIANSLEGKISGITITPSAGGAGGASKILLRGNKSIMGENAPLIVVDGVPMTNSIRNQTGATSMTTGSTSEGSDPLSMINPDDIESMNVLKGANAAALYGSRAANGVVMITTKKGKEGKMEVTFTSNTTFDTPLMTHKLQNYYGGYSSANRAIEGNSWGDKLSGNGTWIHSYAPNRQFFNQTNSDGSQRMLNAHMRNYAADDIADFYETAINTSNSVSVSGGTEKIQTYASYSNTYSKGMIPNNSYQRNTFAFRQTYNLWDRLTVNVSANYNQAKTKNRVGGGTLGNPIYHLYNTPRDVDMQYYKENYSAQGQWLSSGDKEGNGEQPIWQDISGNGSLLMVGKGNVVLTGPMQQYAIQIPMYNNPYWLTNQNQDESIEDRFSASFGGTLKIIEGLNLQGRVSIDHTKYQNEGNTYASTWYDTGMYRYGRYWLNKSRTDEIYVDYMLSYNKEFAKDWSVSATAGYVGHTLKGSSSNTYIDETTEYNITEAGYANIIPTAINLFDPSKGGAGVTNKSTSSNWDQAALATVQIGWKDVIFIDGSYRHDWYRPFRQFAYLGTKESYGYFGVGANAILSDIIKMPEWFTYAKYRLSYSEVGNSIPNSVYNKKTVNNTQGTASIDYTNRFTPIPEKTKSFETGLEMQFLDDCLNLDLTYYNSAMHNSYLEITGTNSGRQIVNTGVIRNQGVEVSVGYDWKLTNHLRWKTNLNFSYNHNRIEETYKDKYGNDRDISTDFGSRYRLLYKKGGSYGDLYITDFTRYRDDVYKYTIIESGKENGVDYTREVVKYTTDPTVVGDDGNAATLVNKAGDIYISNGTPKHGGYVTAASNGKLRHYDKDNTYSKFIGNANSPYQLSWSNTFTYKNFTLYFLINGRIGGKVISLTESYLDQWGASERTGEARRYAEANNITATNELGETQLGMYINEGRDIVGIKDYYYYVGSFDAGSYIYDATNFRLRELSFGYTFRDLFGRDKNLNLSFVCRNLFFIYKDAPVDPDVSVSTGNGLGGIDVFNHPSGRSFGLNIKVNL